MIKVHELSNGLRVVMEAIPFVRSVSFGVWVRNGSRNETPENNGISHFIEHMLFKGTEKRTAMDIADVMDAVGGQLNAFTSKEYTCYFTRTLDTHFDVALDVLSDMFFNSKFDQGEVDKERGVILEEISMYEDTPEDLAVDLLQWKTFPGNPLGMSILGTAESIGSFTSEGFRDFMKARYSPKNVVIAIAGNIDEAEVLEKVTAAFGSYSGAPDIFEEKDAIYVPGFSMREKDIEQVHLCMGFPGIKSGVDESYALAAVNTILGGGMSSRLFQTIREKHGLVYSVYSYNANYWDTGIFLVYAALNPDNVYEVLNLISQEVRGMITNKITNEQLSKAKEQLKSNFLLSLENAASRMNSIGRTLLMLNKTITPDELVEKIDAIDLDSYVAICDRIFRMEQMSLSLVGKKVEGLKEDSLKSAVS
ncbi:MAG: insulinase family protein [Defluviitaleaceae bacterium]|nr:insulinase family protein [Defluviitaleaceae bacterium]MCL2263450.1 insulinase family protein [Defluviitaleaceae bacterium]